MSPLISVASEVLGRSQKPLNGTRPWCLVQAITRHTCPDPHLGSWNCLPHQAHIAPSEPMSSTDQQGSSLDSFPTFPPPYPHFNRPSGFWPCVKSCLVGGSDKKSPADFLETYIWYLTLLSSSSHNPTYVPGPTFGFVKLLASLGSHCPKWADEQHRPAGFESRLVPDLPSPLSPR